MDPLRIIIYANSATDSDSHIILMAFLKHSSTSASKVGVQFLHSLTNWGKKNGL